MQATALNEDWINYKKALINLAAKKKKGSKSDIKLAEQNVAWLKTKLK